MQNGTCHQRKVFQGLEGAWEEKRISFLISSPDPTYLHLSPFCYTISQFDIGKVSEWSKVHDWKSCKVMSLRGFESPPFRSSSLSGGIFLPQSQVPNPLLNPINMPYCVILILLKDPAKAQCQNGPLFLLPSPSLTQNVSRRGYGLHQFFFISLYSISSYLKLAYSFHGYICSEKATKENLK